MDLKTRYLGLELPHPLMPGASPLSTDLDAVRRLEDAGAAAIVMNSLFEEQVAEEELGALHHAESHEDSFAEAGSYLPPADLYRLGPEEYLEQIRRVKQAVSIPVIGSLNGTTPGGWLDYAQLIESAGADALELNVYELVTDPEQGASAVEMRTLDMIQALKQSVSLPVAVKLSPFYTSLPYFARRLEQAGADGLVLFNRFYQADINVEELEVERTLQLSDSSELLLRLRWLAVLSARMNGYLACSGGVHHAQDAIKAVMAGAHAVQIVSALLRKGPEFLRVAREEMSSWLEEHEYDSLEQMRGSMNLERSPDAHAYERANYIQILQTWEVEAS
jgi:dihydroorotate dehydrogenase (fumarate)